MPNINSPYYPYEKVVSAPTYTGIEQIPRQVVNYLLDLPLPGYAPPDNNAFPRPRLIKYLYYDTAQPLLQPLPTTEQKLSILYNADSPTDPPDIARGYRIFPQVYTAQAQTAQQTMLRVYMGRVIPRNNRAEMSVIFDILASTQYESNVKSEALSRTFAIEQCILEALDGVNINGVGGFYFDRNGHSDCGSYSLTDERINVGRRLTLGMTYIGGTEINTPC